MEKLILSFIVMVLFMPLNLLAQEKSDNIKWIYTYPVTIEGKQYVFILSTSALHSSIDAKVASELKNVASTAEKNKPDQRPTAITLAEIKIADQSLRNIPIELMDHSVSSVFGQAMGVHVDGVLGMDIQNKFIWDIDNRNKEISAHSIQERSLEKQYQQCIYYQADDVPIISNITKDGKVLSFVLATASSDSLIDSRLIKQLHLVQTDVANISDDSPAVRVNAENQVSDVKGNFNPYYYLDKFTFGTIPVNRFLFNITGIGEQDEYPYGLSGFLGMNFFNRFDQWQLNPVQKTLCFNSFDNLAENLLRIMRMRAYNGHIELYRNNDRYLKKLNLKNGDVIVSLDNKPYRPDQIEAVRNKFLYQDSVDVEIERKGEIFHVVVK